MSANDIVIIKKEDDGKFRGYHRDYDAYYEGQYDYEGPCQYCLIDGCDMCDGKGYYTSPEETHIFETDTIEGAIHAFDKWCEETTFPVEYGYEFEGLEPNAETVKVLEDSEKGIDVHTCDTVEELMEELNRPDDTELLDFLQQELDKSAYTGKVVCRYSTTGRGWRLLETSGVGAVSDVRQAIINFMKQVKNSKG